MTSALFDIDSDPTHALGAGSVQTGPSGTVVGEDHQPDGSDLHVIGIDVSLTATGIACAHHATVITSTGKRDDTLSQRQQRLRHLRRRVIDHTTRCQPTPDLIVIEGPSYNSKNAASQHDRSGLWWLLIDVFTVRGWRVVEVPPSSLKKYATGKGNAPKDAVLAAAVRRLPFDDLNDNNAADAAWLTAIGHDLLGAPLIELPAAQRAAVDLYRLPRSQERSGEA